MVNIHWTDEASFWLKDIHDYIALDNPKIAKKVINEILIKMIQIMRLEFYSMGIIELLI